MTMTAPKHREPLCREHYMQLDHADRASYRRFRDSETFCGMCEEDAQRMTAPKHTPCHKPHAGHTHHFERGCDECALDELLSIHRAGTHGG
jgi:hypothetical protein